MTSFTTIYASLTGFHILVKANRIGCDSDFAQKVHDRLLSYLEAATDHIQGIMAAERNALKNTDPALTDDLDYTLHAREMSFHTQYIERGAIPLVAYMRDEEGTQSWRDSNGEWFALDSMPVRVDVSDEQLCGLRTIIEAIEQETGLCFSAYQLHFD